MKKEQGATAPTAPETNNKSVCNSTNYYNISISDSPNKTCFNKNKYGNYVIPCLPRKDIDGFKFWINQFDGVV